MSATRAFRESYLDAMGVTSWRLRDADPATAHDIADDDAGTANPPRARDGGVNALPVEVADAATPPDDRSVALAALAARVSTCTACVLHETRTRTVFGVGNPRARVMFIGEAPGAEEDRQGEPFVGRAGQLLNAMLAAIGLRREDVFIANMLKCRPPGNRDPRPDEMASCSAFLHAQIDLVAPRVIVAVGRIAAQNLLSSTLALGRLRGVVHTEPHSGVPLLVTYHPAYLLRRPLDKGKAWQDLRRLRALLEEKA